MNLEYLRNTGTESKGSEDLAVRSLKSGAMDYVVKGADSFRDLPGTTERVLCEWGNLTARKRLEGDILEEQRLIESLIPNSSIATFVVDAEHKVSHGDNACEKLTGVKAGDILGTDNHCTAFYDPKRPCVADIAIDGKLEDMGRHYKTYTESPLIPNGIHAGGWYPHLGGKRRYIIFDAAPLYDLNGKLIAATETLQDITARKQLEEATLKIFGCTLKEHFVNKHPGELSPQKQPDGTVRVSRDITKEVELGERLKEERDSLSLILESMADGVYIISKDYEIEFMNRVLIDELGDHLGGICYKAFHNREEPCPLCKSAEVMKGKIVRWEWHARRMNRTYDLIETPLRNVDGTISKLTIFRDITLRKRMEKKLDESSKFLETVIDNIPDTISLKDSEHRLVLVNKAYCSRAGLTKGEIIGKVVFRQKDNEVLQTGKGLDIQEQTYTDREGNRHDVLVRKAPLIDELGKVSHVLTISNDITEHRRAVERLRRSREKYRTLTENMFDIVYSADSKGVFTYVSPQTKRYGIDPYDLISKNLLEFVHPEDRARIAKDFQRSIEKGEEFPSTFRIIDAEGQVYWLEDRGKIQRDRNGNIAGVSGVLRDVTEQKRAEEERVRLMNELEAKNAELERFTYTISHDLRSPLITIQGFTDVLRDDLAQNEKERMESDLKYIKEGAKKMERLLEDTLQLSRIGRVVNPPEDVPFGDIAREALLQTAEQIKLSGVEVAVADALPTVHVDRMRIEEVLVNLITNSINYMGEQPNPKIDIGYRMDGEETVFFVRDNGIGIEKSQHEKVFDLFYRVDNSSKGTGTGLAIVKRIIEVHRGRVWIESEVGTSCTVCFTLPILL
ncbi:MAG: PAS domain-containing sensor histidine kinase [Halobacteriota archaeon]